MNESGLLTSSSSPSPQSNLYLVQVLATYCIGVTANLQKRLYLVTKFHTLWRAQTDVPTKLQFDCSFFGLEKFKSVFPQTKYKLCDSIN